MAMIATVGVMTMAEVMITVVKARLRSLHYSTMVLLMPLSRWYRRKMMMLCL